jgi:hypothetical protein
LVVDYQNPLVAYHLVVDCLMVAVILMVVDYLIVAENLMALVNLMAVDYHLVA